MSDEKPFPPSEKKLRKLRRQGTIVRAPLLVQAASWFIALLFFSAIDPAQLMIMTLTAPLTIEGLTNAAMESALLAVRWSGSGLVLLAAGVGFIELAQARFTLAVEAITPQPPGGNSFGRIVQSLQTLPGVLCRVFIFALPIGLVAGILVLEKLIEHQTLGTLNVHGSSMITLTWLIGSTALLILGGVEWLNAHRRYKRQHGMTIDEVRREHRESEGDPHTKAERKALHSWLARGELERRVRSSRVILYRRANRSRQSGRGFY